MGECLKRDFPRLHQHSLKGWLSIVCSGPSLEDTWPDIKHPILTCSGAHNFLLSRGIIPDFHVDCDPRPHKLKYIESPHRDTTYLMASCCDPKTWEILRHNKVLVWHMHNGEETCDWITKNDPGSMLVAGGSTVGLRALQIGGLIGYNHFNIYGMDCSKRDGKQRIIDAGAPPHNDKKMRLPSGREFETTDLLINACIEYFRSLEVFPIVCQLHGDGMLKALQDELIKPNAKVIADLVT